MIGAADRRQNGGELRFTPGFRHPTDGAAGPDPPKILPGREMRFRVAGGGKNFRRIGCEEWRDGLRHGKGMWLEVAIYTEENAEYNLGVVEHSYSGQWSKDLPNGEGQEHFSYDLELLKQENMKEGKCITNVIGDFKDGYYNGEMYIMTIDSRRKSADWYGTCEGGVWKPIKKGTTTDAVWESSEKYSDGDPMFHYLLPKENQNYGIMGLKK